MSHDPWFRQPPKPVGDGPDYENIAFHIARGSGWSMDWRNPQWQAPYRAASITQPSDAVAIPAGTVSDNAERSSHAWPIADYAVQLNRTDGRVATTGRPPLLPLVIAFVYQFFERGPNAFAVVRLCLASALALASSLAVALVVRLVTQLTELSWPVVLAALVTMALAALDRTARTYASDFLTEPLAMLLTQLWLWLVCELLLVKPQTAFSGRPTFAQWRREQTLTILSGMVLALLIYTRSVMVLWLPGAWIITVLAARLRYRESGEPGSYDQIETPTWVEDCSRATLMIAVCLLCCLPWWTRNCVVLGTFMPLGTQGPITLVGGYNDETWLRGGEWNVLPESMLRQKVEIDAPPGDIIAREVMVARAASQQVGQWIRANWSRLPRLAFVRLKNEWQPFSGRHLVWKLSALIGLCWLCILHRSAAVILGGIIVVNSITVMMLYSVGGRFLVPTYGILYALAGIGVAGTLAWRKLTPAD
ncbi:MAG: hypothetical protein IT423_08255 [Pirellulaceae bacterium]|nr:hypothetical protein [Pirellulaceae bacterium]